MDERRAAPVIKALRQKVYETAEAEVERVLRRLDHLSDREKEHIRSLSRAITGKLLHEPTLKLKAAVADQNDLLEMVGDLFDLDLEGEEGGPEAADAERAEEPKAERARVDVRLKAFGKAALEGRAGW